MTEPTTNPRQALADDGTGPRSEPSPTLEAANAEWDAEAWRTVQELAPQWGALQTGLEERLAACENRYERRDLEAALVKLDAEKAQTALLLYAVDSDALTVDDSPNGNTARRIKEGSVARAAISAGSYEAACRHVDNFDPDYVRSEGLRPSVIKIRIARFYKPTQADRKAAGVPNTTFTPKEFK